MKRSEVIEHIVNVLRLTGNHYCDDSRDIEDAARILLRLEQLGMLPPKILNPIIKKEPFYKEGMKTGYLLAEVADYYRGETPYKTFVNEWEPEE